MALPIISAAMLIPLLYNIADKMSMKIAKVKKSIEKCSKKWYNNNSKTITYIEEYRNERN